MKCVSECHPTRMSDVKMSKSDMTMRQAMIDVSAATEEIANLYAKVTVKRGPRRTEAIYKLLSEVCRTAKRWRKETRLSQTRLKSSLIDLSDKNFKIGRAPEFMLLRVAIPDRRVVSAWAKVAMLAYGKKIVPNKTGEWIKANGGVDEIIRGWRRRRMTEFDGFSR